MLRRALLALLLIGCTEKVIRFEPAPIVDAGPGPSKSEPGRDASAPRGEPDSGAAAPPDAGPAATKKTSAIVTIGAVARTLERGQFGFDAVDGGGKRLHIEAHEGGVPECPTANTPSPKRTVIVSGVPASAAPGAVFTKAMGVTVSFLDFAGDQLTAPFTKATAVTVTVVSATATEAEIELEASFPEGTVKGRIYATYCESLSQ